jgi:hypothetical protein
MTKQIIPSRRRQIDDELATWGERKLTTAEWVDVVESFQYEQPYDVALLVIRQRRRRQSVDVEPAQPDDESAASFARFVWARSLLLAADADDDAQVQSFRTVVLDGRLLPWDGVEQWLTGQAERDRRNHPGDVNTHRVDVLAYALEGSGRVHMLAVAPGGVLDSLRRLSLQLEKRYGWQPAQGTTFVLAGITPVVPMLRVTQTISVPGRPRITLDVDPDVPTELVAAAYKRARANLLGSRARAPLGRGTELVIHAVEHPGVEVRGLWRQWNDTHPEQRYDTLPGFRQALRDGRRRVLGQPRPQR